MPGSLATNYLALWMSNTQYQGGIKYFAFCQRVFFINYFARDSLNQLHHLITIWRYNDLPEGSEITRASEGPQNGGKMNGMDKLEFTDINWPPLMPKYGENHKTY